MLKHHRTYTCQEIAAQLHVPGQELAKVVILKDSGQFYMAVLPATYQIDLEKLPDVLEVDKIGLATEIELEELFPDCDVGAMPPFGNLYGLDVYVDRTLTEDAEIVFEAGNHDEAMKLAYRDFERLVKPKIASFSELQN